MPNLTGSVTYSTTQQAYGGACLAAGQTASATGVMPTTQQFRVRAHVRTTAYGTEVAASAPGQFWMGMSGANAYAVMESGVGISTTVAINDGAMHALDLRISASGAQFYVDGVLAGSSATSAATAGVSTSNTQIIIGNLGGTFIWAGFIDEIAVSSVIPAAGSYTPAVIDNMETGLLALWHLDSNLTDSAGVAPPATATTLTGPTTGTTGSASTNFTVGANGSITGTVVVTPSSGGGGGTFTPTTVSISSGSPTATFTYTAASAGAKTIATTNNGSLSNPATITYTASAASAATAVTLTGPTVGAVSAASTNFTVGANGTITGTVVVTPSSGGGGGTFTPTTVSISSGSPTATFTYTAASAGAKTISVTNNGSLTNPSNITYTASSGPLYVRVDSADPIAAQAVMVLAPGSGASVPYNSATPTNVILYMHGMGENETGLLTDTLKTGCVNALLNAGYILAGTAAGGLGVQSGIDAVVGLEKYVRANYNVKNVAIWSQSAGGPAGLVTIAQGAIKVVGWLGTYPVCNLSAFNTVGSYTGSVNTAYGVTGSGTGTYANKTYGRDPVLLQGFSFRHVPMRFYASYSDNIVPRASDTDLLAALVAGSCRESTVVACTGDHGDPSHFVPSDYVAFFARCFATPVAMGRPTATKTVTLTLTSDGTTPRANLTGLKWSWWDQATPDLGEYPTGKGTAETTDASGVLVIPLKSNLAAGGVGWLVVTDSDGTTSQSPAANAFSGPVAVA